MADDLTLSCLLAWPLGSLELENEVGGYTLERSTLESTKVTWRRHQVENQWVEGAFTVGAVKENVEETIAVYVTADTPAVLQTRLDALTDAFDRLAYTLTFTEGGVATTWNCQVADYTITRIQALRVAREALVVASVPRSPSKVVAVL